MLHHNVDSYGRRVMTTESMQTLVGVLTVLAMAATVAGVALLVGGSRQWAQQWRADVAPLVLGFVAVVAVATTAGSLYFSEVAGYLPCRWCWYQRTMAYPLAVIMVVAVLRRDAGVRWYAWPLCAIGASMSIWHSLIEKYPQWESSSCSLTAPCSIPPFRAFGTLSLAHMALASFACQAVWLALAPARKVSDV
jgi:disulfide bond formation protein DsbB